MLLLLKLIIVYIFLIVFMGFWMDFIFVKVIMGDKVENYIVVIGFFLMMIKLIVNLLFMVFIVGCVLIVILIIILFILM